MQNVARAGIAFGLIALGYVLGTANVAGPFVAQAQEEQDPDMPSPQSVDRIRAAASAIQEASGALQQEARFIPATDGMNAFAVLAGGVNAVEDLETGRGVDPATFAGLYADLAIPEVAEHLARDDQGRLTYKGKVVRMYPVSRLRQLFKLQMRLRGEEEESL